MSEEKKFVPFVSAETNMAEFTFKSFDHRSYHVCYSWRSKCLPWV